MEGRAREDAALKGLFTAAIHVVRPGEIDVPWNDAPAASFGIKIVVVVLPLPDIIMMDAFDNRAIAVIARQIQMRAPPLLGAIARVVSRQELVQIGVVGDRAGPVMAEGASAA